MISRRKPTLKYDAMMIRSGWFVLCVTLIVSSACSGGSDEGSVAVVTAAGVSSTSATTVPSTEEAAPFTGTDSACDNNWPLLDFDGDRRGYCFREGQTTGKVLDVSDGSVTIQWRGTNQGSLEKLGTVLGLWEPLDVARMYQTRAIDGTMTTVDGTCSWTYSPEDKIVIVCATEDALV